MDSDIKKLIAETLYPDDTLDIALKYVDSDLQDAKRIYSMSEIFKCVEAVLLKEETEKHGY